MTRRFLPIVLLAVAGLAAACSSTSSSTTTTLAPTTTAPSTTTTAKTLACTTKSLAISVGQSQGAAGTIYVPIVFQNTSSTPCTMGGFPGVAGTGVAGQQTSQARRTSATPRTITVAPGSSASALVSATDVPSGTATTCSNFSGLLVTPPNDVNSQALTVQIPDCSGLSVSPVVPGTSGQ